jgi:hypothetical protein
VPGLLTDGTFLPDGRRVLLRTYGSAAVYSYPGFEKIAEAPLPHQEQGEAIAVGDDGRVYLSSEGEGSDVLVVDVPREAPGADPTTGEATDDAQQSPATRPSSEYDPQPWLGLGFWPFLLTVLAAGLAVLLVRAALRRARRRR